MWLHPPEQRPAGIARKRGIEQGDVGQALRLQCLKQALGALIEERLARLLKVIEQDLLDGPVS